MTWDAWEPSIASACTTPAFPAAKRPVAGRQLRNFLALALDWTNHSIRANRRPDGLYHSYNLIQLANRKALPIRRLYEMLEGQVAALSSGHLSPEESVKLLAALKRSRDVPRGPAQLPALSRPPAARAMSRRTTSRPRHLRRSALLRKLLADGNRQLVERDVAGRVHFHATVTNARDLRRLLDELPARRYGTLVKRDTAVVLDIFERLFDHESFTGRSGTFFGYEGLGCIYWHMVSKLLLAVQETYLRAAETGAPQTGAEAIGSRLLRHPCRYRGLQDAGRLRGLPDGSRIRTRPVKVAHGSRDSPGRSRKTCSAASANWASSSKAARFTSAPICLRTEEFVAGRTEFAFFDLAGCPTPSATERGRTRFHLLPGAGHFPARAEQCAHRASRQREQRARGRTAPRCRHQPGDLRADRQRDPDRGLPRLAVGTRRGPGPTNSASGISPGRAVEKPRPPANWDPDALPPRCEPVPCLGPSCRFGAAADWDNPRSAVYGPRVVSTRSSFTPPRHRRTGTISNPVGNGVHGPASTR